MRKNEKSRFLGHFALTARRLGLFILDGQGRRMRDEMESYDEPVSLLSTLNFIRVFPRGEWPPDCLVFSPPYPRFCTDHVEEEATNVESGTEPSSLSNERGKEDGGEFGDRYSI